MDNTARAKVPTLDDGVEAEWVRAHRALSRLTRQRASADAEEGRWLLLARRSAAHVHMGYGTFAEYVERCFGYQARTTHDKLRVAEALEHLPVLAEALESGALCWSALREVTRVATPETEAAWLGAARGKLARELEPLVARAHPGDLPSEARSAPLRRHILRFEVMPETFAAFREAMVHLRRASDARIDDDAALLAMARAVLGGPCDDGRASYQLSLSVCPDCGRGTQNAGGTSVSVGPEVVDMMICDAQHIGSVVQGEPHRAANLEPTSPKQAPTSRERAPTVAELERATVAVQRAAAEPVRAEHAPASEEAAPFSEKRAPRERAPFSEERAPSEHTPSSEKRARRERAPFSEERAPREHAPSSEERAPREHAPFSEERGTREHAPYSEECVPRECAPFSEERAPRECARSLEERVPSERASTAAAPPAEPASIRTGAARTAAAPRASSAHVGRRAKQTIPPALRRYVQHRDQHRCRVPGCQNTTYLDVHHIVPRSEGGQNTAANLIDICGVHHRATHAGTLLIDGTADALRVRHADGTPYGERADPRALDVQAKVISALRNLGFREMEVRAVLDVLRRERCDEAWSVERLLRAALERMSTGRVSRARH